MLSLKFPGESKSQIFDLRGRLPIALLRDHKNALLLPAALFFCAKNHAPITLDNTLPHNSRDQKHKL